MPDADYKRLRRIIKEAWRSTPDPEVARAVLHHRLVEEPTLSALYDQLLRDVLEEMVWAEEEATFSPSAVTVRVAWRLGLVGFGKPKKGWSA